MIDYLLPCDMRLCLESSGCRAGCLSEFSRAFWRTAANRPSSSIDSSSEGVMTRKKQSVSSESSHLRLSRSSYSCSEPQHGFFPALLFECWCSFSISDNSAAAARRTFFAESLIADMQYGRRAWKSTPEQSA